MLRFLKRSILHNQGEGGSTGIGEEQLSMMGELLGAEPIDPEEDGEEPQGGEADLGTDDASAGEPTLDEPLEEGDEEEGQEPTLEEVNNNLREQIVQLMEQVNLDPMRQSVQENPTGSTEPKAGESSEPGTNAPQQLQDFLSQEELDRIIDEPGLLNVAFQRAQSAQMASMASIIQQEVNRQILINRAITDFYTANNDLAPYAKFVQFVMAENEVKYKDKTYAEIFDITANDCRKRLGLTAKRTRQDSQATGKQKPAFAGSKKGQSGRVKGKGMFDDNAADML